MDLHKRLQFMTTRVAYISAWVAALSALALGLVYYSALPDSMISHWGTSGQANAYVNKFAGVVLMPIIIVLTSSILLYIPRFDPLRKNIESFRPEFDLFVVLFAFVLAVIQFAVIATNLGNTFNISLVVIPALGVLLFFVGTILPWTKRNWFIGIRTPWTISSDEVWVRTHKLGGRLFKILGLLAIATVLAPDYAPLTFVAPLAVFVVALIVYSYLEYRKLDKEK